MIDPKELRCGNWVKCPKGLAEVKVIDSRTCDILTWPTKVSDWCGKASDLQPIPLSITVLSACGCMFSLANGMFMMTIKLPNDYRIDIISMSHDGHCDAFIRLSSNDIGIYSATLHYLHQLQNLCFALTGKELEIDEEKLKKVL